MSIKKWVQNSIDRQQVSACAEECGIDAFTALLLMSRGIDDPMAMEEFLSAEPVLPSPFDFIDMQKAVERIRAAIDGGEHIAVFADYDCDGVTACALLYDYLRAAGAVVDYRTPTREEGYGISTAAIDELHAKGVSLIITVDNGITAVDEIAYAATLGIDVVVSDHHIAAGQLPEAVAVVDPKRADCPSEFKEYAGVGVAFMLVCALEDSEPVELLREYGDLVTLGTIADVMPLVLDNRCIVRYGLQLLNATARPGLRALIEEAGLNKKPLTATGCAFGICPRINAAGRVASPDIAVRLLLCEDEQQAASLAAELAAANSLRHELEDEILHEAVQQLEQDERRMYSPFLCVAGEGWHHGVIGIVAARLCSRYQRPCAVFSIDNGVATGSARGYDGVSVYDIITACSAVVTRFGGHSGAAGLTLDAAQLSEFSRLAADAVRQLYGYLPFSQQMVCCKLNPKRLGVSYAYSQQQLQPFGAHNEQPVYGLFNMKIDAVTPVGGGNHLRLTLSREGARLTAMRFSTTAQQLGYAAGDTADFLVTLDINSYKGEESLSIIIKDMRPSAVDYTRLYDDIRRYEYYRAFGITDGCSAPEREQLAAIYKILRQRRDILAREDRLVEIFGCDFFTLRVSLDILAQLGLITLTLGEQTKIGYIENVQRVDLESSAILQALRGGGC